MLREVDAEMCEGEGEMMGIFCIQVEADVGGDKKGGGG